MSRTPAGEYDEWLAGLSPEIVRAMFVDHGCTQVLVKRMAPQDNGKNQVYVGPDLSDVAVIPSGTVKSSTTVSRKPGAEGKTKFIAPVDWVWLAPKGDSPAPGAKLIFYPQYPEVRLSGLVDHSVDPPSSQYSYIRTADGGQARGRRLLIGVSSSDTRVFAMILPPNAVAIPEIDRLASDDAQGVFHHWHVADREEVGSTRETVLARLAEVHRLGWVSGQKLNAAGALDYGKSNAQGYTLEAMLGVAANSVAGPDYLGWELKTHKANKISLFTPAPKAGWMTTVPRIEFMQRFGTSKPATPTTPQRWDFTGIHQVGRWNASTELALAIHGWDGANGISPDGAVRLVDHQDAVIMEWGFDHLMTRWKSKHSQAIYVPYRRRTTNGVAEFMFGSDLVIGIGTRFTYLLRGFATQAVVYDPGHNIKWEEGARGWRWKPHDRHQFRTTLATLDPLYEQVERVSLPV